MEDGVTDAERLPQQPPSELINSHGGAVHETAGGGGLLSNLISNLVVPRSVAETGEDEKGDDINKSSEQGKEDEDDKEGGFIKQLISDIVSPSNREVGEGGKAEVENGGGGGLINSLISNIFNQSDHQDEGPKEKSEEAKRSEEEAKGDGGGGGIINSLVSHLPSLSENAAPATDEASILIHSIVHD